MGRMLGFRSLLTSPFTRYRIFHKRVMPGQFGREFLNGVSYAILGYIDRLRVKLVNRSFSAFEPDGFWWDCPGNLLIDRKIATRAAVDSVTSAQPDLHRAPLYPIGKDIRIGRGFVYTV